MQIKKAQILGLCLLLFSVAGVGFEGTRQEKGSFFVYFLNRKIAIQCYMPSFHAPEMAKKQSLKKECRQLINNRITVIPNSRKDLALAWRANHVKNETETREFCGHFHYKGNGGQKSHHIMRK